MILAILSRCGYDHEGAFIVHGGRFVDEVHHQLLGLDQHLCEQSQILGFQDKLSKKLGFNFNISSLKHFPDSVSHNLVSVIFLRKSFQIIGI